MVLSNLNLFSTHLCRLPSIILAIGPYIVGHILARGKYAVRIMNLQGMAWANIFVTLQRLTSPSYTRPNDDRPFLSNLLPSSAFMASRAKWPRPGSRFHLVSPTNIPRFTSDKLHSDIGRGRQPIFHAFLSLLNHLGHSACKKPCVDHEFLLSNGMICHQAITRPIHHDKIRTPSRARAGY